MLAQDKFDVRKTRWGMTKSEIISSENPLHPSANNQNFKDDLVFDNVELSNGFTTNLIYTFRNGKLIKVLYCIYGPKYQNSKGTCNHIIPFVDKVHYSYSTFTSIFSKGFKYDHIFNDWTFSNSTISGAKDYANNYRHSTDDSTLRKVAKFASENNYCKIGLHFENERTNLSFNFNEYQNCENELKINRLLNLPCDDDIYNIYSWLEFSPTYEILKEMEKNDL